MNGNYFYLDYFCRSIVFLGFLDELRGSTISIVENVIHLYRGRQWLRHFQCVGHVKQNVTNHILFHQRRERAQFIP